MRLLHDNGFEAVVTELDGYGSLGEVTFRLPKLITVVAVTVDYEHVTVDELMEMMNLGVEQGDRDELHKLRTYSLGGKIEVPEKEYEKALILLEIYKNCGDILLRSKTRADRVTKFKWVLSTGKNYQKEQIKFYCNRKGMSVEPKDFAACFEIEGSKEVVITFSESDRIDDIEAILVDKYGASPGVMKEFSEALIKTIEVMDTYKQTLGDIKTVIDKASSKVSGKVDDAVKRVSEFDLKGKVDDTVKKVSDIDISVEDIKESLMDIGYEVKDLLERLLRK